MAVNELWQIVIWGNPSNKWTIYIQFRDWGKLVEKPLVP